MRGKSRHPFCCRRPNYTKKQDKKQALSSIFGNFEIFRIKGLIFSQMGI